MKSSERDRLMGKRWWLACCLAPWLVIAGCSSAENEPLSESQPAAPEMEIQTRRPEPLETVDEGPQIDAEDNIAAVEPIVSSSAKNDVARSNQRQELFQGWQKPQLALLITGRQHGYIEPCGCTGLENQKGGLARRHTLAKQLADRGWPLLAVDVGNQVRRLGRQAEMKFQVTAQGLRKIDYQVVALGPDDLRLSVGELVAVTASSPNTPSMFVCANAAVLDRSLTSRFRVVQIGGKKVGITAILGARQRAQIDSDEIILQEAEQGLQEVWEKLQQEKCDLYLLLAHADIEETRSLARRFPQFDLIVTAGGAEEPAFEPERIGEGKTWLIQTGSKGMYVGVLGWMEDEETPFRYQRVPLNNRFADSPDMLHLLASYQQELKRAGLVGLGVKPSPHPSGRTFVGSQACADCHSTAYEIWGRSGHARATESLIHPEQRSEIARHYDPECITCHVTGWSPQRIYPYSSGYLSLQESPLMRSSGCENCHGPGSDHVAAENGDVEVDELGLAKRRAAMRLPLAEAEQKCMECHDLDNSLDFHKPGGFEKYWSRIEHKGLD